MHSPLPRYLHARFRRGGRKSWIIDSATFILLPGAFTSLVLLNCLHPVARANAVRSPSLMLRRRSCKV